MIFFLILVSVNTLIDFNFKSDSIVWKIQSIFLKKKIIFEILQKILYTIPLLREVPLRSTKCFMYEQFMYVLDYIFL